MIEQHATLGPTATKHLDGIMETAERAGSLTRQLLAFGGRQLLHPKTIDLNVVVRDSVRLIGPAIGERIRVVIDLDPELERVHADVGQIEQVLLNLGLNARDAMPHGGTIYIATSNVDTPAGTQARVTFEDTGTGMDEATVARVFEPFFTTKRGGRGTGLGLATAYGIIKQSAGDIAAASTPGKGSKFTILLPAVPHAAAENAPYRSPTRHGLSRPLGVSRVLLVEDNEGVRNFAREVLTRAGVKVAVASDGAEGIAVARAQGYEVDMIVTDIVMPELSGPQMVARIREARPELPVLFVTGWADDAVTREDMQMGREALIEKPFTAQALRDAIQTLAAGRVEKTVTV
jgi:two-component system cell cycle sensor histidine kinase/response regulator CckA